MRVLASLQDITEILGEDSVRCLLKYWGGVRLYVPHRIRENHPIAQKLSADKFQLLVRHFGGETLNLPCKMQRSTKKAEIIDLLEGDLSHRQIALQVGVSQRYVEKIAAMLRH